LPNSDGDLWKRSHLRTWTADLLSRTLQKHFQVAKMRGRIINDPGAGPREQKNLDRDSFFDRLLEINEAGTNQLLS
jgi:hypothetical protein